MTQRWDGGTTVPDMPAAVTASDIASQFPGCCAWYGEATGRWWAVVLCLDGEWRLVEAIDPYDLVDAIRANLPPHRP